MTSGRQRRYASPSRRPRERAVQRSRRNAAPGGQLQVGRIMGGQTLGPGDRQDLSKRSTVRILVGRDRQTVQEFKMRRGLGRREPFPSFCLRQDVTDLQAPVSLAPLHLFGGNKPRDRLASSRDDHLAPLCNLVEQRRQVRLRGTSSSRGRLRPLSNSLRFSFQRNVIFVVQWSILTHQEQYQLHAHTTPSTRRCPASASEARRRSSGCAPATRPVDAGSG